MSGPSAGAALRILGVRKRFGAREVLRGLDLSVPTGSIFGLIGPNGAGKTTTFSIACGYLQPDAGTVEIFGEGPFDPRRLKGRMTAMPQDAVLGGDLRCREHLEYFGRLQGLPSAVARSAASEALTALGLADRAETPSRTLSHGMLRRLGVAQALLGEPALVILDEPTAGLDPRHAHELRELLGRHRGARTLVISSHNLGELETLCDHVAFIDQGVCVGGGPIDEVTGRGEEVEIELAAGAAPPANLIAKVTAALAGDEVRWDAATRVLSIRAAASAEAGRAVEELITLALRTLIEAGARISTVRRGRSLEKRYLELT